MKNLLQHLEKYQIILASASERRQTLLKDLDLTFSTLSLDIVEDYPATLNPQKVPIFLAEKKADAYVFKSEKELLITADTIVILGDKILGKPKDILEAELFLKQLQQQTHQVITAVCVKTEVKKEVFSVTTQVKFGILDEAELAYSLAKNPHLDKAGAYGVQEWIGKIGIEKIEGDYYNIMGLPLHALYQCLKNW